jgi:hypothetical protein
MPIRIGLGIGVTSSGSGDSGVPPGVSLQWNATADTYVTAAAGVLPAIHGNIKRCVLNSNGAVNYYLDPADSTLKAGGGASVLTGADGNVMVEIPKFWFKYTRDGVNNIWEVSSGPQSGFAVHPAFIKAGVEVDKRYVGAYDACLRFSRSITDVADAGSGDITVTTSVQHPLYAGDSVTISGTTSYNGTFTVVTRASTTTFTVTAAFVATETGTASGWVSGKNLDDMTANIATATDSLASVSGQYPLVGVTRAKCRTLGTGAGSGWHQLDFALWSAIQMLYLTEYGTFASQAQLGAGNTNGSYLSSSDVQTDSPHTIAGASNTAFASASTDGSQASAGAKPGTAYMSYRGIENIFGNCWNWVDGINVNQVTAGTVYYTNEYEDFADNTTSNYTEIATALPTAKGFEKDILSGIGFGFLSSSNSGGSSTTFLTDQHDASPALGRVVYVGGDANTGALAGLFCVFSNFNASVDGRDIGARLAF